MKHLLEEYLAELNEDKELAILVEDLCSSMGLQILFGPQKGARQAGVDIHAVGIDPIDNIEKNFLITIKRGNVDRNEWDRPQQGVRASLDEIFDIYLTQRMGPNERKLPSKIILCCGGELNQVVQENWSGYQTKLSNHNFSLWNGDLLSKDILKYLLSEQIFFDEVRLGMKRTLVLLEDQDYDLRHYKKTLRKIFTDEKWSTLNRTSLERAFLKVLLTVPASLNLISHYSKSANNLKHPLIAAEYTLLIIWHYIIKFNLQENTKVITGYQRIYDLHTDFGIEYYNKIAKHTVVQDGFTRACGNHITASEVVFEHIGILSTLGLIQIFYSFITKKEEQKNSAVNIADTIIAAIKNNEISGSPNFDEKTIEVTLAIYLFILTDRVDLAKEWIIELIKRFQFSYLILGKYFPISNNSMETLLEYEYEGRFSKEQMIKTSTLLTTLAYWCAILDFTEGYEYLLKFVNENLKETDCQLWYPAKGIKEFLYVEYSGDYGFTEVPIVFPGSPQELKLRLNSLMKTAKENEKFETIWNDCPVVLPLLASRHYRTPVIPFYWLEFARDDGNIGKTTDTLSNKEHNV